MARGKSEPIPPVGANMERCRRELGLSAADAARRIGVEPITFYRWRSGKTVPQWEHVLAASKVFRRTPEWFYADHGKPPEPKSNAGPVEGTPDLVKLVIHRPSEEVAA